MSIELYLIRHGETEWSSSGRHTGRTEIPLTSAGEKHAAWLSARLGAIKFTHVFTSPRGRAMRTCELAGLSATAVIEPDLAEWDYGAYEGLTTSRIRQERPGWDLFADGVPGGESAADVARRVDRVIARVRRVPGDVACVAHSHVLRVFAARWIGLDPSVGRSLVLDPAAYSELGWDRECPVVRTWNRR
jgi:probable phosphoglycerate mutase